MKELVTDEDIDWIEAALAGVRGRLPAGQKTISSHLLGAAIRELRQRRQHQGYKVGGVIALFLLGCSSGSVAIIGPADTAAPVDTGPLPYDPPAPVVHIVLVLDNHISNGQNHNDLDLEIDGYGGAYATWAMLEVGHGGGRYRRISDVTEPLDFELPYDSAPPPIFEAIERSLTIEPVPVVWLVVSERDSVDGLVPGSLPADHKVATWRPGLPNVVDAVQATGGIDCAGTLACFGDWPWNL